MERFGFVLVIVFLAIGTVSAQNRGNQWEVSQSVTLEGTLQLQNGQIALSTGNTIYFVPILERYIGFIDRLREGARVSITGYTSGNFLQPIQMTLDGKSYDFQANTGGFGFNNNVGAFGPCCYGYGAGRGGWGRRW